jgi:hypothetical protein
VVFDEGIEDPSDELREGSDVVEPQEPRSVLPVPTRQSATAVDLHRHWSAAVTAHVSKMRRERGEESATPLEKLLIQRLALCWLACHAAEVERAEFLQGGAGERLKAADKRVDRAHVRLMTATKTLATVRKLITPVTLKLAPLVEPGVHIVPA